MRQNQSIVVAFHKHTDIAKNEHRIRLNVSIDVARHLLNGELPFVAMTSLKSLFIEAFFGNNQVNS